MAHFPQVVKWTVVSKLIILGCVCALREICNREKDYFYFSCLLLFSFGVDIFPLPERIRNEVISWIERILVSYVRGKYVGFLLRK